MVFLPLPPPDRVARLIRASNGPDTCSCETSSEKRAQVRSTADGGATNSYSNRPKKDTARQRATATFSKCRSSGSRRPFLELDIFQLGSAEPDSRTQGSCFFNDRPKRSEIISKYNADELIAVKSQIAPPPTISKIVSAVCLRGKKSVARGYSDVSNFDCKRHRAPAVQINTRG